MLGQVEAVDAFGNIALGFDGDFEQADVGHFVYAVVSNVVVPVGVANQIVTPVGRRHLIGADDVGLGSARVQFQIDAVAVVGERNFPFPAYGVV